MLEAISHIWNIVKEEAKQRGWVGVIKALIGLAGLIGFSLYALHPLVQLLFPQSVVAAWVIMISFAIVVTLLVVINFIHSYYERTNVKALDVWKRDTARLEKLYSLESHGKMLSEKCNGDSLSVNDMRNISAWHRNVGGFLEREIGNEYRRRFYEHSETFESAPDSPHECQLWIDTRLVKIREVIEELKQPPAQLASYRSKSRIEAGAGQYPEIGKDHSDW